MAGRGRPREYAFRYGVIIIGFLIGVVLVFVIASPLSTGDRAIPLPLVVGALVIGLAVLLGATTVGLLIGRRLVGDRLEIALRAPGGPWRHGRAEVVEGRLRFQPYLWQIRIPNGAAEDLTIERVSGGSGRRPRPRNLWALSPQVRIVDVWTPDGQVELAALPSRIDLLRDRLPLT